MKLDGNNNIGPATKVGATNNADLKIITNDTVRQTIQSNGNIIMEKNLTVKGKLFADMMNVSRILPPANDSIINFGTNTIFLNTKTNRISWTPISFPTCSIGGLSIGNGLFAPLAFGLNSIAIGSTTTGCSATNSIVMGTGINNNIANSFMLGFGSTAIYADAARTGVFTTAPTQTLDVNGTARVRTLPVFSAPKNLVVADSVGVLGKLGFTGNTNHVLRGNGTWGLLPALPPSFWSANGSNIYFNTGNVGIRTSSPTSALSVGAASQFQVNAAGNIVKINNIASSFPAAQGGVSTVLTNDGAGNLSWTAGAGG